MAALSSSRRAEWAGGGGHTAGVWQPASTTNASMSPYADAEAQVLQTDLARQQAKRQQQLFDQLLGGGIFGGGGSPSQPGFADSPGSPGLPGGGSVIGDLLGDGGAGQRARIDDTFDTLQKNAMGHLESRGLGGSSLVANAMAGIGREKTLAHGELDDRLFDRQFQAREASLNRSTQLLAQLLGGIL